MAAKQQLLIRMTWYLAGFYSRYRCICVLRMKFVGWSMHSEQLYTDNDNDDDNDDDDDDDDNDGHTTDKSWLHRLVLAFR